MEVTVSVAIAAIAGSIVIGALLVLLLQRVLARKQLNRPVSVSRASSRANGTRWIRASQGDLIAIVIMFGVTALGVFLFGWAYSNLFTSIPEGDISVDDLEILATNLAALIPISSAKLGFVLPRTASVIRAYCCAPHRR